MIDDELAIGSTSPTGAPALSDLGDPIGLLKAILEGEEVKAPLEGEVSKPGAACDAEDSARTCSSSRPDPRPKGKLSFCCLPHFAAVGIAKSNNK